MICELCGLGVYPAFLGDMILLEHVGAYPKPADRALLRVPRGINIVGMVRDADRLEIAGALLSPFVTARELLIAPGGAYTGEIEVDDAEIHGTMDGSILVRRSLVLHATGKILGAARCGILRVEPGGHITARLEMIARP